MKFTLIYIIALVIFSVNGVLSGIRKTPKTLGKGIPSGGKTTKTLGKGIPSGSKTPKTIKIPTIPKTIIPSGGKAPKTITEGNEGFCAGKTLSDGRQIPEGSCSEGIQGTIPSSDKMPSTLIINPPNGGNLLANVEFDVDIVVNNLATGKFSDPETQYNILPQTLDDNGVILGHTHVTIQALNGKVPPNSKEFAFFKGVNTKAGPDGQLTVTVISDDGKQKGLPVGDYRICAMTGAFSHQPPVLPVAKRGAQDDCIRIGVSLPTTPKTPKV